MKSLQRLKKAVLEENPIRVFGKKHCVNYLLVGEPVKPFENIIRYYQDDFEVYVGFLIAYFKKESSIFLPHAWYILDQNVIDPTPFREKHSWDHFEDVKYVGCQVEFTEDLTKLKQSVNWKTLKMFVRRLL